MFMNMPKQVSCDKGQQDQRPPNILQAAEFADGFVKITPFRFCCQLQILQPHILLLQFGQCSADLRRFLLFQAVPLGKAPLLQEFLTLGF